MRLFGSIIAAFVLSSCSTPAPKCTPANCNGCCDSSAGCLDGLSESSCGKFGETCAPCRTGGTCAAGQCMGGVGGATQCAGPTPSCGRNRG